MDALAKFFGNLLKPIIIAAVKEALQQMKDTGEVGKQNADLQTSWGSNEQRSKDQVAEK